MSVLETCLKRTYELGDKLGDWEVPQLILAVLLVLAAWRHRWVGLWILAAAKYMKAIRRFISPIFSISAALFVPSFVVANATGGGIGPCGFTSPLGVFSVFGVWIGTVGMAVGLPVTGIKTYRQFRAAGGKQKNAEGHEDITA